MSCPVIEQHLQTSPPAGRRGIPPPFIGRPRTRPTNDPERRVTGDRQNQAERNGRAPPPPGHPDRCPVRTEDLDRDGYRMHERRRGRREVAWPRWHIGASFRDGSSAPWAHVPKCPLAATSRAGHLDAVCPAAKVLVGFLAPSYEADLLAGTAPAGTDRGQDRSMAQKALDPCQTALDLPAWHG